MAMKKYWISLAVLALVDAYLAYATAFYGWMTSYYTDPLNVKLALKYFSTFGIAFAIVSVIMVAIVTHIVRTHINAKRLKA